MIFLMIMNIGFNFQKTMSTQQYNSVGEGGCQIWNLVSHESKVWTWLTEGTGSDHFGITSNQFGFPEFHVALNGSFKKVMVVIIVTKSLNVK